MEPERSAEGIRGKRRRYSGAVMVGELSSQAHSFVPAWGESAGCESRRSDAGLIRSDECETTGISIALNMHRFPPREASVITAIVKREGSTPNLSSWRRDGAQRRDHRIKQPTTCQPAPSLSCLNDFPRHSSQRQLSRPLAGTPPTVCHSFRRCRCRSHCRTCASRPPPSPSAGSGPAPSLLPTPTPTWC